MQDGTGGRDGTGEIEGSTRGPRGPKNFPVTSGPEFRQIFCKSLEVSALLEEREKSNERIMV